jgi:hypothetical protein
MVLHGLQLAFFAEHEAFLQAEARRDGLVKAIGAMVADSKVQTSRAWPGVPAQGLDADRVRVGRRARRLGPPDRCQDRCVPAVIATESSSGQSRSQGSITKTGNTIALPEPADTPAARSRLEVRTTDAGRMDGTCGFRQFGMAPEDDQSRRAWASASAAPSRPRRSPRTLQGHVRTRSDWPKLRCSTWSSYTRLLGSMPGRPSMARHRLGPPIRGTPDSRGQSSRLSQPRLLGSIFLMRKHTATPGGQRNEGTA